MTEADTGRKVAEVPRLGQSNFAPAVCDALFGAARNLRRAGPLLSVVMILGLLASACSGAAPTKVVPPTEPIPYLPAEPCQTGWNLSSEYQKGIPLGTVVWTVANDNTVAGIGVVSGAQPDYRGICVYSIWGSVVGKDGVTPGTGYFLTTAVDSLVVPVKFKPLVEEGALGVRAADMSGTMTGKGRIMRQPGKKDDVVVQFEIKGPGGVTPPDPWRPAAELVYKPFTGKFYGYILPPVFGPQNKPTPGGTN